MPSDPTDEHFLPLLVAMGASRGADAVETIDGGITHGALSMDCFAWGTPTVETPSARLGGGA